jgi:hypothetical protein
MKLWNVRSDFRYYEAKNHDYPGGELDEAA